MSLEVFRRRRVLLLVPLGFASGLPYALTSSTLSAWLTAAGASLGDIGLFSIVALPYSLKFLWAPLLDRFAAPLCGRRRGWIVLFQLAVAGALVALGAVGPRLPLAFAALALLVTAFAATQDIVADAYRTDLLAPDERAAGTATFVVGYRVAMIVTGGLALVLADHLPFGVVYQLAAPLVAVGVVAAALAPEPPAVAAPPTMRQAVVEPLRDWFARAGALRLLAFITVYRVADLVAAAMVIPFLLSLGFSNTEIGLVNKNVGIAATIVGALAGGAIVARVGLRRPLVVFGLLTPLSNLLWTAQALVGKNQLVLLVAVAGHNLCVGLGIATLEALILGACNRRFGATQYALLGSAAGLGGRLAAAGSGFAAARLGWPLFFAASALVCAAAVAALLPATDRTSPSAPASA